MFANRFGKHTSTDDSPSSGKAGRGLRSILFPSSQTFGERSGRSKSSPCGQVRTGTPRGASDVGRFEGRNTSTSRCAWFNESCHHTNRSCPGVNDLRAVIQELTGEWDSLQASLPQEKVNEQSQFFFAHQEQEHVTRDGNSERANRHRPTAKPGTARTLLKATVVWRLTLLGLKMAQFLSLHISRNKVPRKSIRSINRRFCPFAHPQFFLPCCSSPTASTSNRSRDVRNCGQGKIDSTSTLEFAIGV